VRTRLRLIVLAATFAAALLLYVQVAIAAPPSSPMTITTSTFEDAYPYGFTDIYARNIQGEEPTVAYWGRISEVKRTGTYSLWCAGRAYPGDAVRPYGLYPLTTRGRAYKNLPDVADYYSATLSFYYLLPSRGAADLDSFVLRTSAIDAAGDPVGSSMTISDFPLTSASGWTNKQFDLSSPSGEVNLSRKASRFTFDFFDYIEYDGQTPASGYGASIDDVVVSGYKYGPVRALSGSFGGSPGAWTISLGWQRPYRATNSTDLEERAVGYKIWRSVKNSGVWVDLTPSGPVSVSTGNPSAVFFDDGPFVDYVTYTYVVVPYDAGGGYGEAQQTDVQAGDMTPPATTASVSPAVPASGWIKTNASVTLSAVDSAGGEGVAHTYYKVDGGGQTTYASPFSVTTEGLHSVEYWSVDLPGNLESPHKMTDFKIDKTSPTTPLDLTATPFDSDETTLTWSASADALSGLDHYDVYDGTFRVTFATGTSTTIPLVAGGTHSFTVRAVDVAGNVSDASPSVRVVAGPAIPERLSSANRYSTAVAIARAGFDADGDAANGTDWTGVTDIVIASGEDRAAADPLAASGLCWRYDAPLFLVSSYAVTSEVKAAVREIADQNAAAAPGGRIVVHIVGGPGSVPDARYSDIAASVGASRLAPDRVISVGNRYDLAAAISRRMEESGGKPPVVLIANGADANKFFDALALSPIAAKKGYPILLVSATSVPAATASRISEIKADNPGFDKTVVGGGPATVSDAVKASLSAERWWGANRYTTAIDIADHAIASSWLSDWTVGVAAKLPDALTGGSMVGRRGGVLLVTSGTSLTPETGTWLSTHKASVSACYVFGGPASVTPTVMAQIEARLE
jgi:putative cell wall-binding protein